MSSHNAGKTPRPRKVRRAQSKKRTSTKRDDALLSLARCENAAGLGTLLNVRGLATADALTPPGSVLDAVVRAIRRETDCPTELGVISTFAVLSAALCKAGTTYCYHDDPRPIDPALWLVALAESGAGKTFVRDIVAKALGIELPSIPTPGSGPAYIDALREVGCRGFWDKDEYGQTIKQISRDSTMAALKDVLLQSYDNRPISNQTRKHGVVELQHPVLVIYGATPDDSLGSCIDAEMLIDGFAARHLWAPVENRRLELYRYNTARICASITAHPSVDTLRSILAQQRHYVITASALQELQTRMAETLGEIGDSLRRGFIRRITYAAGHYALMYHLLTQREPGERIGVNAARWGWRMVIFHLHGARRALTLADPQLAAVLGRMMAWVARVRSENLSTQELVRRFLQRFSREVSNVQEARQMLAVCGVRV